MGSIRPCRSFSMEARPSRHPSAPSSGAVGSRLRSDRSSLYSLAIVTVLSWGVLAFGSVHPWAYVPLLVMAGAVGIAGLLESKEQAGAYRGMAAALGALCLVGALQMVPLSTEARLAVSPASDRFPGRQSAEPPTGGTPVAAATRTSAVRPLSVDPERTAVGVVLLGGLSLFLLGTARRLSTGDVVSVVRGLLVLGAVLALVGIIQRPFYSGKIYGFWEPQFGGDAFGPFSNRNHFAGWMIMTIPIGLGYFCSGVAAGMRGVKPLLRERLLWFASPAANQLVLIGYALVVMAVSLVLTMSRSGLSSFCVALALLGWFAVRAPGAAFRRSLMTGYFAFVLAIASGWVGVEAIGQRFASASWDDVGGALAGVAGCGTGHLRLSARRHRYPHVRDRQQDLPITRDPPPIRRCAQRLPADCGRGRTATEHRRRGLSWRPGPSDQTSLPRRQGAGALDGVLAACGCCGRVGGDRTAGGGRLQPAKARKRGAVRDARGSCGPSFVPCARSLVSIRA